MFNFDAEVAGIASGARLKPIRRQLQATGILLHDACS